MGSIIAQGIFVSLLLFIYPRNASANIFLGLLLLSFSLWLCDTFFRLALVYQQDPNYYFLPIYYSFAFGPLLYFYTLALTSQQFRFKSIYLVHFIPSFFQGTLYLFLQLQSYDFRYWFWFEVHRPYTYNFEFNFSLLSLFIYTLWAIFRVRDYQIWLKNNYSELSKINLNWLKLVQVLIAVLCLVWLIDVSLREFFEIYLNQNFSALAMGLAILILAGGGLSQNNLNHVGIQSQASSSNKKSKEISLNPALLRKIKSTMQNQAYFLDPDLSLDTFAKEIQEPARNVSYHINHGLGISFVDFVNDFRVKKVQAHLQNQDLKHMTLLGIALESGFNSKSTFNRIFKKFTGKSPKEYLNQCQSTN